MFGSKIRTWMEAHIVRPKKKHRKEANAKGRAGGADVSEGKDGERHQEAGPGPTRVYHQQNSTATPLRQPPLQPRRQPYGDEGGSCGAPAGRGPVTALASSNNLSSPESAYSTGYSTDGTSPSATCPGGQAPEYYINIRTGTRYYHATETTRVEVIDPPPPTPPQATSSCRLASPSLAASPRQRTRIRTNPWVAGGVACVCSPLHGPQRPQGGVPQPLTPSLKPRAPRNAGWNSGAPVVSTASPVRRKWPCSTDKKHSCPKCQGCSRFDGFSPFSSSSSSSLSVDSVHAADTSRRPQVPQVSQQDAAASDDEDDRTLNEMMGKYDESYVYEKETDILSDSDPTDCDEDYDDTDAETGREGGDERDLLDDDDDDDDDLDFIDNASLELNLSDENGRYVNRGHCTYHSFPGETVPARRSSVSRRDAGSRQASRRASAGGQGNGSRRRSRRSRFSSTKKRRERGPPPPPIAGPDAEARRTLFADLNRALLSRPALRLLGAAEGSRSAGATPLSVRRRRALVHHVSQTPAGITSRQDTRCHSISYSAGLRRVSFDSEIVLNEMDKEADRKYRELIIEAEHILMSMKTSGPVVTPIPPIVSPRRANPGPANKRVELLRNAEWASAEALKAPCPVPSDAKVKFSPKKNHITNFINNNSPAPLRRDLEGRLERASPLAVRREPPSAKASIVTFHPQHCPQSEPVKRKVYARTHLGAPRTDGDEDAKKVEPTTENGTAPDSGAETVHRQKVFQTLSSLKRNLESHSESLRHSRYGSDQRLPR